MRTGAAVLAMASVGQKGRVTEVEADLLAEIDVLDSAPVHGGTPRSPLDDEPR